jgi:hypothetical protein
MMVSVIRRDFADHLELVPSATGLHVAALTRGSAARRIEPLRAISAMQASVRVCFIADPRLGRASDGPYQPARPPVAEIATAPSRLSTR